MSIKNKQKVKKILDIATFVAFFLFFICSLLCLIARFNGARFSLLGNRYDVVLTDSMSEKNPEHLDFLKDDNNQIKAFDLVISRELPKPEEIKTHDIVIYTDRYIGTNMHRVVDIDLSYYERVEFKKASKVEINGKTGVTLDEVSSGIFTNDIRFKTMSFTTYSTLENTNNFNVFCLTSLFEPEITREEAPGGGFYTTYKLTRDTESPGSLKISHRDIYDYSKEIITSLHIDSKAGAIDVNFADLLPSNEESDDLLQTFNKQYIYEIRGDAAKTSDGWYSFDELQAVVVKSLPGMGYPIRFMGSIWGGLMFGLLGLLVVIADIIMDKLNKKETLQNASSAPDEEQKPVKENTKPIEQKPIEQSKIEASKPVEQPKVEATEQVTVPPKPVEKPAPAPVVQQPQAEQPKSTPARVNGRFVSKNAQNVPSKPTLNGSRWTKDNNPSANKKSTEGGQK